MVMTIKFVITRFLGVQIDNNISSAYIHRCSSACFAMMAVMGLQFSMLCHDGSYGVDDNRYF
jgi:hypothetical protein